MIHYPELKIGDQVVVASGSVVRVAGSRMGRRTLNADLVGQVSKVLLGAVWVVAPDDTRPHKKIMWACLRRQCRALTDIEVLALAAKQKKQDPRIPAKRAARS